MSDENHNGLAQLARRVERMERAVADHGLSLAVQEVQFEMLSLGQAKINSTLTRIFYICLTALVGLAIQIIYNGVIKS